MYQKKFKSEKAITGVDITTAVLVFILFTSVVFSLYLQIYKQSAIVKIHQDAMGYIIQICEDIDMQNYENIEDIQIYKKELINKYYIPENKYSLNMSQQKYIDINNQALDIVKRITISIGYNFDGEYRNIEINKIKIKE